MARDTFPQALDLVLKHEGGYTNDPRDPGNWTGGRRGKGVLKGTKKGIAAASYPHLDIKNLGDSTIAEIYRANYWRPISGDDLPVGVDYSTFDYGVNSGVGRSAKHLQSVVGASVDGRIGPATLRAVLAMAPAKIIKALCAKRLSFLKGLAIWKTFKNGWSRRVAEVEAIALSWVLSKPELQVEANDASKKSQDQAKAGGATGAGGVVLPAGADQVAHPDLWLTLGIGAVILIIAVGLIAQSIINSQRATALRQLAKEA